MTLRDLVKVECVVGVSSFRRIDVVCALDFHRFVRHKVVVFALQEAQAGKQREHKAAQLGEDEKQAGRLEARVAQFREQLAAPMAGGLAAGDKARIEQLQARHLPSAARRACMLNSLLQSQRMCWWINSGNCHAVNGHIGAPV